MAVCGVTLLFLLLVVSPALTNVQGLLYHLKCPDNSAGCSQYTAPNTSPVNLVVLRTTRITASRVWSHHVAAHAVDGNPSTYYHSHAAIQTWPWWQVELEQEALVWEVQVLPNIIHTQHFTDIEVRVGEHAPTTAGDYASWPLLGRYERPTPSQRSTITFHTHQPLRGRFVAVQRTRTGNGHSYSDNYLVIAEVKVMGQYM